MLIVRRGMRSDLGFLPMAKERRDQISVTLDRELRLKVERAAEQERRTMSNEVAFLLWKAFEHQERAA
jgi:hypothetical protein